MESLSDIDKALLQIMIAARVVETNVLEEHLSQLCIENCQEEIPSIPEVLKRINAQLRKLSLEVRTVVMKGVTGESNASRGDAVGKSFGGGGRSSGRLRRGDGSSSRTRRSKRGRGDDIEEEEYKEEEEEEKNLQNGREVAEIDDVEDESSEANSARLVHYHCVVNTLDDFVATEASNYLLYYLHLSPLDIPVSHYLSLPPMSLSTVSHCLTLPLVSHHPPVPTT